MNRFIFSLLFVLPTCAFGQLNSSNQNTKSMSVAVWDTYVPKKEGGVLHFDVVVPENVKDPQVIYDYGKMYLKSIGQEGQKLSSAECRFCHIESPDAEILKSINDQGYYIIEMDDVPAKLPQNPTRRDMVLYLRGHFEEYRFADLRSKSEAELKEILLKNNIKI